MSVKYTCSTCGHVDDDAQECPHCTPRKPARRRLRVVGGQDVEGRG
jgi:rubrerythrin